VRGVWARGHRAAAGLRRIENLITGPVASFGWHRARAGTGV